jgi:integrase
MVSTGDHDTLGLRIGECLALRRCDVDMTTQPPTLVVNGTIVTNKTQGTHRKDTPKRYRRGSPSDK